MSTYALMTVLNADTKAKIVGLSPLQANKVGRIITHMQGSDMEFSNEEIDLVVKSLYVSQSDEDLQAAFDMLDKKLNDGKAEGHLKADAFKKVLPLVGEDVPPEKIDELFKEVDSDGSGQIEFDEFKALMLAMNPKDGDKGSFGNMSFTPRDIPGASSVMGGISSFGSSLGDNFTTLSVLKSTTNAKLMGGSPLLLGKVGRIIKAMQSSEYNFTNDEIDDVVKSLYVTKSDEDFQKVFDMFDKRLSGGDGQGFLGAEKFKKVLPLLGEDVPPEKIDEVFAQVDSDGSGNIEFDEFKTLMLAMNPDKQGDGKITPFGF